MFCASVAKMKESICEPPGRFPNCIWTWQLRFRMNKCTLRETNSSTLKINGWKAYFQRLWLLVLGSVSHHQADSSQQQVTINLPLFKWIWATKKPNLNNPNVDASQQTKNNTRIRLAITKNPKLLIPNSNFECNPDRLTWFLKGQHVALVLQQNDGTLSRIFCLRSMVQKSHSQPPFGCMKPVVNNGIFTNLNWWVYRISEPSIVCSSIWMFPKIVGKPLKWMVKIMENPITMDGLGVPLFLETAIYV